MGIHIRLTSSLYTRPELATTPSRTTRSSTHSSSDASLVASKILSTTSKRWAEREIPNACSHGSAGVSQLGAAIETHLLVLSVPLATLEQALNDRLEPGIDWHDVVCHRG
jgi:hypothetical protein